MDFPTVSFDAEADALYVYLNPGTVKETVSLGDLRMVDYSDDGTVVGIEFVSVSAGVDLRDVPFAETVEQAIGASGHHIPIFA